MNSLVFRRARPAQRTSPAGRNVALTAATAATRAGETYHVGACCVTRRCLWYRLQQHVARLIDPGRQPVRPAAVGMGGAHQPMVGGADLRLGGAGVQAEHLVGLLAGHAALRGAAAAGAAAGRCGGARRPCGRPATPPDQRAEHGQRAEGDAAAAGQDQQQRQADAAQRGDPGEQRLDRGDGGALERPQPAEEQEQGQAAEDEPQHVSDRSSERAHSYYRSSFADH